MENMTGLPTPEEASAALADAEASRTLLARGLALPSFFYGSIGTAVAVQIATAALGIADVGSWAPWLMLAGLVALLLVAGIQLARFRRLNGVWLGGFASRVVGGTASAASTSYLLAFGAAVWAAFDRLWWLVALCALTGGVAYAMSRAGGCGSTEPSPRSTVGASRQRGWPSWASLRWPAWCSW